MSNNIGVVGLGVMGANLARNIESRGFTVAGYDVDAAKTTAFLDGPASGSAIVGARTPEELAEALERPRRVLMMVPAGKPVDSVIAHLQPHLEPGDILIDGGNSYFKDTDRRTDDARGRRLAVRRHRRVRRRGGRAAWPGDHAGRLVARDGTGSRPSSRRSRPRPTMASRAWSTWGRAAPGTT